MNNSTDNGLEKPYIISSKNLTKRFGSEVAVNAMDLHIPEGTIFGLIGPSGCGKTTTIRLMTGIYKPTSGELRVLGKNPGNFSSTDRERIGYLLQQSVLYPDLTVWENLNFSASFYGVSPFRQQRLNELLEFVELAEHKHKVSRHLSGGMNRRLSLAATLVHDPNLLFLDEPTAGIDPILRQKFWVYFKELQKNGRTLVVTTQYVGEAEHCDLVGVVFRGRLLKVDTPEGMRNRVYGGEIIRLATNETIEFEHRKHFENLDFTSGSTLAIDDNEVEIVVEGEANRIIPQLIEICRQKGLNIKMIEKKTPSFDDVFVKLINVQVNDDQDS